MKDMVVLLMLLALVGAGAASSPPDSPDCCVEPVRPPTTAHEYHPVRFGRLPTLNGEKAPRELRTGDTITTFAGVAATRTMPPRELTLDPVPTSSRRFGFVLAGCGSPTALMRIDASGISASTTATPAAEQVTCAVPMYYYAVFDVPSEDVKDPVRFLN